MTHPKRTVRYARAVGLHYDGDGAPTIAVKGYYFSADEIVAIARKYGVPVVERPGLVGVLEAIDVDEEIPKELYEAVATVINEIDSRKDGQVKNSRGYRAKAGDMEPF